MRTAIIEGTFSALLSTTHPRFLRSERGYQGHLYCSLQEELDRRGILRDQLILEMEYQKSTRHNLTQRPDIVLHSPAEETGAAVSDNNIAVYALKLQASRALACEDFEKLDSICNELQYQLAIFINVNSEANHMECYEGVHPDRVHGFAVSVRSERSKVTHAWWQDGILHQEVRENP